MKRIYSFLTSKFNISASSLVTILATYFLIFLNFSFWRFVFIHAEPAGFVGCLFSISIPLLIFTLFYIAFSILLLPYIGKTLFILLLIISAATNYLMFQFGIFIDADMIRNTFETNPGEVKDLITPNSVLWLTLLGILPAILLVRTKIQYMSFAKEAISRLKCSIILLLCLVVLCPFVYKEYASFGRNNRQVRRLVNPFNYIYATVKYFQMEHLKKRPFIKLDASASHVPLPNEEKTIFVVVLGETARAMNFSLNGYQRLTNPELAKEDIINFEHVQSAGTATAFSVPSIFSFYTRKGFDPADARNTENLLDILQQTGVEILWKENDNGCKGVCSRVPNVEMDITDKRFCDGTYCHDEILLEGLEDFIANFKGNQLFIVLHTIGSHGPTYFRRYPAPYKKFTPTCDTEEIQNCSKEQVVNTYDNTILYTDHIVASTINILKKFPKYESGLLYVSDHGESLGENGLYLHGVPYSIAPKEQTSVPMILWMNDAMKKLNHIDYECLKKEAKESNFSHDNISHSLASIMETQTKVYDSELDIFSKCRTTPTTK